MDKTFEVGEIAIIILPICAYYLEECVITGPLKFTKIFYGNKGIDDPIDRDCYAYQVMVDGVIGYLRPQDLRKKPPKDDSRDKGNWNDCVWKPGLLNNIIDSINKEVESNT